MLLRADALYSKPNSFIYRVCSVLLFYNVSVSMVCRNQRANMYSRKLYPPLHKIEILWSSVIQAVSSVYRIVGPLVTFFVENALETESNI